MKLTSVFDRLKQYPKTKRVAESPKPAVKKSYKRVRNLY